MTTITLDRETLDGLAGSLDRMAADLPDAERIQLMALLAVGASEVAHRATPQPFDVSAGFRGALQPLTGPEVEVFGEHWPGDTSFNPNPPFALLVTNTAGSASRGGTTSSGSGSHR